MHVTSNAEEFPPFAELALQSEDSLILCRSRNLCRQVRWRCLSITSRDREGRSESVLFFQAAWLSRQVDSHEAFLARHSTGWARKRLVFHHFPITRNLALVKCRQFSVLGLTRGSLGSFYTAIVRRPLIHHSRANVSRIKFIILPMDSPTTPGAARSAARHARNLLHGSGV